MPSSSRPAPASSRSTPMRRRPSDWRAKVRPTCSSRCRGAASNWPGRPSSRQAVTGVSIAGCLSPLFGSYAPALTISFDETVDIYRRIVAEQADHVDLFLCETMASADEALAAVTAACEAGKPVWVSWTLADHGAPRLRSGETLAVASARARRSARRCASRQLQPARSGHRRPARPDRAWRPGRRLCQRLHRGRSPEAWRHGRGAACPP